MRRKVCTLLQRVGSSMPCRPSGVWGRAVHNAQLRRDRQRAYPTSAVAAEVAVAWLLEQAWCGVPGRQLHAAVPDDNGVPLVVAYDQLAWSSRTKAGVDRRRGG